MAGLDAAGQRADRSKKIHLGCRGLRSHTLERNGTWSAVIR